MYIWLLQEIIEDNPENKNIEEVWPQIQTVINMQPSIETIYGTVCFVLGFDYKKPELCESVNKKGLELFPKSWLISTAQGYMSYFELEDYVKGAYYYENAAKSPNAPPYIKRVANKILNEKWKDKRAKKKEILHLLLKNSKDAKFNAYLKQKITEYSEE